MEDKVQILLLEEKIRILKKFKNEYKKLLDMFREENVQLKKEISSLTGAGNGK